MRRNVRSLRLCGAILLLIAGYTVRAQTVAEPSPTPPIVASPSLEREFFKNILRDQKAIWGSPRQLHRADAKWLVPSGVGLMALFTTDRITGDELSEFHRQVQTSRIMSYPGSTYGAGAIAATFYFLGRKQNNARARETGILSAEALIDSFIVASALKGITQRARPQTGRERSEFFDGGNSFPSGHSIQAWSTATVIASEYHDRPIVQISAYGIAGAVSLARFTAGKHYISDVLVGSALGYGIGKYVYHTHHRKSWQAEDDGETSRSLLIAPRVSPRAREYGVGLTWSF